MDMFLWLLAISVMGTVDGQIDCVYLDISWASTQPNREVGNGGPFSMRVSPNRYTNASQVEGKCHNLLSC